VKTSARPTSSRAAAPARRVAGRRSISVGFAPVADADATRLILGSLPGTASLAAQQYYAQPRNAFWRVMGVVLGAGLDLPYAARLERLQHAGIALWDVCRAAHRPGSLDADIDADSVRVNDFRRFLLAHPRIERIAHNGATSARLYEQHVLTRLPTRLQELPRVRLPSTSPAHAAMPFESKLAAWQAFIETGREWSRPRPQNGAPEPGSRMG
jgi:double-stranded uracil-DNA glycosylase